MEIPWQSKACLAGDPRGPSGLGRMGLCGRPGDSGRRGPGSTGARAWLECHYPFFTCAALQGGEPK